MATTIITLKEARDQGLKYYFTGIPCPKGHISKRTVSTQSCYECTLASKKEWDKKNKEHIQEYNLENRQRILNKKTEHRIKNKEKFAEATARYRKNNRDKYLKAKAVYREKHSEKISQWWKNNRDLGRVYHCRRTKRVKDNTKGCHFTKNDINILYKIQKGKCIYCKSSLELGYHLDHIMPLYLGGDNSKDNLQLTCPTCNLKKGHKHPIDFAQQNGRLL